MVGGVLHTHQVSVGPSVQVRVLAADVSVASVPGFALTTVHGVGELPQVVTAGVLVAVMSPVQAGVTGRAYLETSRSRELSCCLFDELLPRKYW